MSGKDELTKMLNQLVKRKLYKWNKNKTECFPVKNIDNLISKTEKTTNYKRIK